MSEEEDEEDYEDCSDEEEWEEEWEELSSEEELDLGDPALINFVKDQEPFTLRPLIEEILRTQYCTPGSIFLVEEIKHIPVPNSGGYQIIRLLLSDGEACIQAVLKGQIHPFVDSHEVFVGSYVRVPKFELRASHLGRERRYISEKGEVKGKVKYLKKLGYNNYGPSDGLPTSMVYLLVDDLITIGWHTALIQLPQEADNPFLEEYLALKSGLGQPTETTGDARHVDPIQATIHSTPRQSEEREEDDFRGMAMDVDEPVMTSELSAMSLDPSDHSMTRQEAEPMSIDAGYATTTSRAEQERWDKDTPRKRKVEEEDPSQDPDDPFAEFEAKLFPTKSPRKVQKFTERTTTTTTNPTLTPVALPKDWHSIQIPLKLTTLHSISNLPYSQNWSCNVLAIVTQISPVETSYLSPYRQRTARIADPSTAKQVLLTVFLDPEEFNPSVGSAVLLVGVKNHRFDGGSLKKYASDGVAGRGKGKGKAREVATERWWFEDPWEMQWCDVGGIRNWWEEMQLALASIEQEDGEY